jgi:hypothetical protein
VISRHCVQEECATPPPPEGGEEGHVAAEQKRVELERLISFLEHQLTGRLTVHMQKQAEVRRYNTTHTTALLVALLIVTLIVTQQ